MPESRLEIRWSDYMQYRARLRGFDLAEIERILRHSNERYFDTVTERLIAIGRIDDVLVLIPFDAEPDSIEPITIHATTRQQINFRLRTGRFVHE